jgi:hypothetical protein
VRKKGGEWCACSGVASETMKDEELEVKEVQGEPLGARS